VAWRASNTRAGRLAIGKRAGGREAFAGGVSGGESHGILRKGQKVVAVAAQIAELPLSRRIIDRVRARSI